MEERYLSREMIQCSGELTEHETGQQRETGRISLMTTWSPSATQRKLIAGKVGHSYSKRGEETS